MTDTEIRITNIVYSALSFFSFIFGAASILLNRCYYYRYKDKYLLDTIQGIFFLAMIALSTFALFESFQWFLLIKNFVGCTVLGAIREYILVSLLVLCFCWGIHLLILMKSPKCLQVITIQKQKRYNMINRIYVITSLLVPALVVPWPFFTTNYGKNSFICWLANTEHNNASRTPVLFIVNNLLMWHLWAILVWLFAVGMILFAFCRYCVYQSVSKTTKSKPTMNIIVIISLLTAFIIDVTVNALFFVQGLIISKFSFHIALQVAIITPFMIMVYTFILTIRQMCIIKRTLSKQKVIATINTSQATHNGSYGTTMTNYILPDDEWY